MPERTHCDLCGLPMELCYHQMAEYRDAPKNNMEEFLRVARNLYEQALRQIPMDELRTLRAPRRWQMEILNNHYHSRTRNPLRIDIESEEDEEVWAGIEDVERMSAWTRLMQDDD